LPILRAVQADEALGDGVRFDVEGQPGDPDDEVAPAGGGEGPGQRQQQVLPQGPQGGSLHKAPPGVQSHPCSNPTGRVCTRGALVNPPGRPTPVCPFMSPGSWLGNYWLRSFSDVGTRFPMPTRRTPTGRNGWACSLAQTESGPSPAADMV